MGKTNEEIREAVAELDKSNKTGADNNALHVRLHKIAGQINGIDRMIDRGASCEEILVQLNAARAGLLRCAKIILSDHVRQSVDDCLANGDVDKAMEDLSIVLDRFTAIV